MLASIALIGSAYIATAPLSEVGSMNHVSGAVLTRPVSYVVLAPLFNTLDLVSVLTLRQHAALMLSVFFGVAGGIVAAHARSSSSRLLIAVRAVATAVSVLLVLYFASALLWRPMTALHLSDRDDVVIDFHSHSSASHDGRPGFDAERSREWHRAGGFHVAYVTDHRSFAGVREAALRNPRFSAEETVLLGGLELVAHGHHVNLLGVAPRDSIFYPNGEYNRTKHHASETVGSAPLVLLTIPTQLARLSRDVPLDAVELSDGAPRGIAISLHERQSLLRMADSLNIAVVAGSNNHGWGRTVAAWSVVHIPGWRQLSPDGLAAAIRSAIRDRGRNAVRVVERSAMLSMERGTLLAAFTGPSMLWVLATTMSPVERASWLAWLWALYLFQRLRVRRAQQVTVAGKGDRRPLSEPLGAAQPELRG